MKIFYITDTHLKDTAPACRKDDYTTAILDKFQDAVNIANEHEAQLLHGGDLFDSPRTSLALLCRLWQILRSYWAKPMAMALGNHEWKGSWQDWSGKSPLTLLELAGLIRIYDPDFTRTAGGNNVIHMIHKQLVEKPVPWEHMLYQDYDGPGNIVLVSDYHPFQGHKVVKIGKKRVHFIAPGAVARGSRAETDKARVPCGALIEIDGPDVKCKFIPLPSAKPMEDVYSDEVEDTVEEKRQSFGEAVTRLKELSSQIKICSVLDVLEIVSRKTNPSKEAKELCRSRLSR